MKHPINIPWQLEKAGQWELAVDNQKLITGLSLIV